MTYQYIKNIKYPKLIQQDFYTEHFKMLLGEIKTNKWKNMSVHGLKNSVIERCQFSPLRFNAVSNKIPKDLLVL